MVVCVLSLSWHDGVQATALPRIPEAVAAANASTRPGPKGAQVVSRQLSEHGLRVEVWPWRYLPEDGRTGTLCKTSQGTGPENRTNKWLPCFPQFCLSILSFSQHTRVVHSLTHSLTAIPGEEAVLVSMKKAIDICVYYTLGREAKVRRLAYKDQVRRQRCCLLRAILYD